MREFTCAAVLRRYDGLHSCGQFASDVILGTLQCRAGVVQWQYRSFPSFGRGFDSHRPLHNSRVNCPYTADLPESSMKMKRFGPQMDPDEFNWTPMI
jgi:hypothetical protein